MGDTGMILEVKDLVAGYGLTPVLHGVSLDLGPGEQVAVLGRNGVGKTTLFRALTSTDGVRIHDGSVKVLGRDAIGLNAYQIGRLGVAYVPQGRRVFPSLSVNEHLLLAWRKWSRSGRENGWSPEKVYELFPELRERKRVAAGKLSGGEQSMLSIARALVTNPRLLLMDEPSEGLAPVVIKRVKEICLYVKEMGVPLLLAEQNLDVASIAERVCVLSSGAVVYIGKAENLFKSEFVRDYLLLK